MDSTVFEIKQVAQNERRHFRLPFYIGMGVLLAVVFVRNIALPGIPVFLVLAIAAVIAVIGNQDEMIALVATCIPLSTAFQYKYLIAICILLYVIKFGKEIKITTAILPLVFMMIWELSHGIPYLFSFVEYFRDFSELMWCTLLMLSIRKRVDYPFIVRTLSVATLCMMTVVLLNLLMVTGFDFEAIFTGTYRFGTTNEGTNQNYGIDYNANGLGFIANLSITGLLQLNFFKRKKTVDYVMIVALILFGFMTMSRSFLICLALILVLFIMSGKVSLAERIKRLLLVAVLVALLIFLVVQFMPTVVEQFAGRFQEDDISNGRNDLFAFYTEHIFSKFEYLFYGIGLQNFAGKIASIYGNSVEVCHNSIQELIVCWGIPGLLLFVWFLGQMLTQKGKKTKLNLIRLAPLVLVLFYSQSGQLITDGSKLLALSVSYSSLCWIQEDM